MSWFDDETYEYLADLADNNEREWFNANKKRYEGTIKEPALQFIRDFGPRLAELSPHFTAIPKAVGGSLFRIYRDTRFSKDKTPYKTHVGIHFRHARAKDVHAPGFYLHLEPNASMFGAGIWRPDSASVKAIRAAIDSAPEEWLAMKEAVLASGLAFGGEALKRIPRGYDKEHPLAEDLKRKDFIVHTMIPEEVTMADDFLDTFAGYCAAAMPLTAFLCSAVGVES